MGTMPGRVEQKCQNCESTIGFMRSDDGFFYCGLCGAQADDIVDTGVDEEQLFNRYSASLSRPRHTHAIAAEPISQVKLTSSQYHDHPDILVDDDMGDEIGPTGPSDFGSQQKNFSYDDYYSEIRSRYLTGLQILIQSQCQTLVEEFNVSPLIVGLVGPIWLRFLASTRIMTNEWADQAVHDSEAQAQGEADEFQPSAKYRAEPVNIHGRRLVMIWYRSLSSRIPIHYSLAISFLVCHVAREAIFPSDILQWALEGKLPYFTAFGEIEKHLGSKSEACPISINRMFRPIRAISSQKLESTAADIAKKIGLELPPVNFYAIASRFCRQLSLPPKILTVACHICEWSMLPELYLSVNEFRIPTRVYVMSILIVAIRILFDINGYGMWELSLSDPSRGKKRETAGKVSSSNNSVPHGTESDVLDSKLNVAELLQNLEAKYNDHDDVNAYSYDLRSYLEYCKDVVFSGLRPSYEDLEEEKLLKEFWDFYQNSKDTGMLDQEAWNSPRSDGLHHKRSRIATNSRQEKACNTSQNNGTSDLHSKCRMDQDNPAHEYQDPECSSGSSLESQKERAIEEMKLDMEENKFCYIAPRTKVKRRDYLHYARKRNDVYIYAVHADYYVLLRTCAKVARVETRIMHVAVLSFERRLRWLEKRIDDSLHYKPNSSDVCDFCCDGPVLNGGNVAKEPSI